MGRPLVFLAALGGDAAVLVGEVTLSRCSPHPDPRPQNL